MITVVIETRNDEVRLAHALAALVPAATEGVVSDVVLIDHGSVDGSLVVADAAGCTVIEALRATGDPRRIAADAARGEWLLFLSLSTALAPGWQREALAFIARSMVAGKAGDRSATLRHGRIATGWVARLGSLFGGDDARLVAKSTWLRGATPSPVSSSASSVSDARRGAA